LSEPHVAVRRDEQALPTPRARVAAAAQSAQRASARAPVRARRALAAVPEVVAAVPEVVAAVCCS